MAKATAKAGTRKIGGSIYKALSCSTSKTAAQRKAKSIRYTQKRKARVLKVGKKVCVFVGPKLKRKAKRKTTKKR